MAQEKELSAALFDEQILFAAEHSTKPSWENGVKRQLSITSHDSDCPERLGERGTIIDKKLVFTVW